MRRLILIISLVSSLLLGSAGSALAQAELSSAACNQGTMNAHGRVPETNGAGNPIKAHEHIPEQEDSACSHG